METKDTVPITQYWQLRRELAEQKELNKLLQMNMFHYEFRCRDALIENMKLQDEIDRLRAKKEATE